MKKNLEQLLKEAHMEAVSYSSEQLLRDLQRNQKPTTLWASLRESSTLNRVLGALVTSLGLGLGYLYINQSSSIQDNDLRSTEQSTGAGQKTPNNNPQGSSFVGNKSDTVKTKGGNDTQGTLVVQQSTTTDSRSTISASNQKVQAPVQNTTTTTKSFSAQGNGMPAILSMPQDKMKANGTGGLIWTDSLFATRLVINGSSVGRGGSLSVNGGDSKFDMQGRRSYSADSLLKILGVSIEGDNNIRVRCWRKTIYKTLFYELYFEDGKRHHLLARADTTITADVAVSNLMPLYVVNNEGVIAHFSHEIIADGHNPFDIEDLLNRKGEKDALDKIKEYRALAESRGQKLFVRPSTYDEKPFVRKIDTLSQRYDNLDYLQCDITWTREERREQFDLSNMANVNQNLYKDSCVVISVKPDGKNPLYLLYLPTPEFLSVLPHETALQIRAEKGDEDAIRELQTSFKGCRFMSFCKTSSGAIEDTEVLGSTSSNVQLRINLREERKISLSLFDINGRLVADIEREKLMSKGDFIIPILFRPPVGSSSGFYLLEIRSDAGERVTQRIVLTR